MLRYQMSRWEQSPVEIYHLLFIDKVVSQTDASDDPRFDSQFVTLAFREADHVMAAPSLTNRTASLTKGLRGQPGSLSPTPDKNSALNPALYPSTGPVLLALFILTWPFTTPSAKLCGEQLSGGNTCFLFSFFNKVDAQVLRWTQNSQHQHLILSFLALSLLLQRELNPPS